MFNCFLHKNTQTRLCCVGIALFLLGPVGASAATILAAFSVNGTKLKCENPYQTIGGIDARGMALVLGLNFGYGRLRGNGRHLQTGAAINPIDISKKLDACTPLFLGAMVQKQQVLAILTIFDANPDDGMIRPKTRITLDNAHIVGVNVVGKTTFTVPQSSTTQELIQIMPQQVTVEDLVAGTSFQFDYATSP